MKKGTRHSLKTKNKVSRTMRRRGRLVRELLEKFELEESKKLKKGKKNG